MVQSGKRIRDLLVWGSLLLLATGCGPVHTTVKPQAGALEKINSVAVVVPADGEFTVYYERAKGTATGAVLFGLVGAAISSSYNSSEDSKIAEALRPQLTDLSCHDTFRTAIARVLGESRKFADVRVLNSEPAGAERAKYDAIATFRFVSWGFRLVDQNNPERVSAFLDLNATLQKAGNETPLWDENVTVIGKETHSLSEFREKPDVTRREMGAVMDDAAYRLANNLIYN
jgi:hypothetical protein